METSTWLWVIGGVFTAFAAVISGFVRVLSAGLRSHIAEDKEVHDDVIALRLKLADEYPKRIELDNLLKPIYEILRRIEDKLDKKADKP